MNEYSELRRVACLVLPVTPTGQLTKASWSVLENSANSSTKAIWHHFCFQDSDQIEGRTILARIGLVGAGVGVGRSTEQPSAYLTFPTPEAPREPGGMPLPCPQRVTSDFWGPGVADPQIMGVGGWGGERQKEGRAQ